MTLFELSTLALLVLSSLFGLMGWLLNRLLNHQRQLTLDKENHRRELTAEKNRTSESKFERLIERIDTLVEQIGHLFRDQEIVTESVDQLGKRLGAVEIRVGEHYAICKEREKIVKDLKKRQDSAFCQYDKTLKHRKNEPCVIDRTDMES